MTSSRKPFYITTAIDYVNGEPHIGHAYEKIATDVIARHFKQRNREVFFLTGSDEHGAKIEKTAAAAGIEPKAHCDKISDAFKAAWKEIDIDYDRYIRTTDKDHEKVVQWAFSKLLEKGDIYKSSYKGLYCTGCECFLSAKDLDEEGKCPIHQAKPQEVEEENYFFKLSNYKDKIIAHIQANPDFILPSFRVNELINQIKDIEDISVSRSKNSVSWGVPVPNDEEQIIYVWIDALTNYITGVGVLEDKELFEKFWPCDVHVIGKDILKFHAIYWIAFLMALDLPLPKSIFAHGWITIDEAKMSKSLGNVISPKTIMESFELTCSDPIRYYLMTTASFGRDGNYSDEDFKSKVNSDLANNFGNLLNRTLSMLIKYFDGEVKSEIVVGADCELAKSAENLKKSVKNYFDGYQITEAISSIVSYLDEVNKYVNDTAPWSLAKSEETLVECGKILYSVLEAMAQVALLIYPITPNLAKNVWQQLSLDSDKISETMIDDFAWNSLKLGKITDKESIKPVFLRLDSEFAVNKK